MFTGLPVQLSVPNTLSRFNGGVFPGKPAGMINKVTATALLQPFPHGIGHRDFLKRDRMHRDTGYFSPGNKLSGIGIHHLHLQGE